MTALKEYQRLEAWGLWRAAPDAQRRNVVVKLGEATLTILDPQDRVLAHWSIAAISRANPGREPALFHPDGDPGETLELAADQPEMIAGIERLRRAIDRSRPQPGKLRFFIGGALAAGVLALAVFWLPGALRDHAVRVVPSAKRAEIGNALLDRIVRVAGRPCAEPQAREPLRKLSRRMLGGGAAPGALVVLPGGVADTAHLPGGTILLNRALIEDPEDPDVPAGFILAEAMRLAASDPMRDLLGHAGLAETLRLLTTGHLTDAALDAYAEHLLVEPRRALEPAALLAAFAAAELRSSPYAYARDITGESTLPLIEADPRAESGSRTVLTDPEWLQLQAICGA